MARKDCGCICLCLLPRVWSMKTRIPPLELQGWWRHYMGWYRGFGISFSISVTCSDLQADPKLGMHDIFIWLVFLHIHDESFQFHKFSRGLLHFKIALCSRHYSSCDAPNMGYRVAQLLKHTFSIPIMHNLIVTSSKRHSSFQLKSGFQPLLTLLLHYARGSQLATCKQNSAHQPFMFG